MTAFLRNKYRDKYLKIIKTARQRASIDCYTEIHHIIPRSLGGDDRGSNLVILTAREHYVCHWLLTKFLEGPNKYKMIAAFCSFFTRSNQHDLPLTSYEYERARLARSEASKFFSAGERNGMFGRKHSEETKAKMKKKAVGRGVGEKNNMFGKTHSEEARDKIRQARTGTTNSEESNQKRSETLKLAYADGTKSKEHVKKAQASRRTPTVINGVLYGSREEAKKALGISHTQFFRMIKDGRLKIETAAVDIKPLPDIYGEEIW